MVGRPHARSAASTAASLSAFGHGLSESGRPVRVWPACPSLASRAESGSAADVRAAGQSLSEGSAQISSWVSVSDQAVES
jgi:hypothetical protein